MAAKREYRVIEYPDNAFYAQVRVWRRQWWRVVLFLPGDWGKWKNIDSFGRVGFSTNLLSKNIHDAMQHVYSHKRRHHEFEIVNVYPVQ